MTDPLLDEATRLAKAAWQYPEVANTLRALVDEAPDNLLDELRTLLAILDGKE